MCTREKKQCTLYHVTLYVVIKTAKLFNACDLVLLKFPLKYLFYFYILVNNFFCFCRKMSFFKVFL